MSTESSTPMAADGAVEAVWARLADDLRGYISRRVRRPEDVEDVLQTVFLRISTGIGALRDDERLLRWIYTLTRNAVTDHYRRASTRRELPFDELPATLHPLQQADDEQTSVAELARCLRPMIARLPPEQATALDLVELQGVSQVEAARRAGVSVSGMKSRVQRGRSRLRELVLDCCSVQLDARGAPHGVALRGEQCGACPTPRTPNTPEQTWTP